MLVKDVIKGLKNLDPNDEIWITWIDRDELVDKINEYEYTDENDNYVEVDRTIVTNDFAKEIWNGLDNDDYLWERFSETYSDHVTEKVESYIESLKKKSVEVEVEQLEKELWD